MIYTSNYLGTPNKRFKPFTPLTGTAFRSPLTKRYECLQRVCCPSRQAATGQRQSVEPGHFRSCVDGSDLSKPQAIQCLSDAFPIPPPPRYLTSVSAQYAAASQKPLLPMTFLQLHFLCAGGLFYDFQDAEVGVGFYWATVEFTTTIDGPECVKTQPSF